MRYIFLINGKFKSGKNIMCDYLKYTRNIKTYRFNDSIKETTKNIILMDLICRSNICIPDFESESEYKYIKRIFDKSVVIPIRINRLHGGYDKLETFNFTHIIENTSTVEHFYNKINLIFNKII